MIVTLGGVTIGLLALARTGFDWWPGRKAFTGSKRDKLDLVLPLAPFVWGFSYGVLACLTHGGIVLWLMSWIVTIISTVGDWALLIGVGSDLGQAAERASVSKLSAQANAAMLLLTGIVWFARARWANPDLTRGIVCGLSLGLTSGIAGQAAAPLARLLDTVAVAVYGVFA